MRNSQLLEYIKQWDLKPNARNRISYIQTLQHFSVDRSGWLVLFCRWHDIKSQGFRNRITAIQKHKGPRTTKTSSGRKYVKSSTLRREQLMIRGHESWRPSRTVDIRSKDMRTQAQVRGLTEWVSNFTRMHRCGFIESVPG
jgi:hypothetical protein